MPGVKSPAGPNTPTATSLAPCSALFMPIFRTVGPGSSCLPSLCWLQPSPHGKHPTPEAEVFPATVPVRVQPLH